MSETDTGSISSVHTETPELLLKSISSGNRKAEHQLIERYSKSLYFILYKRVQDPDLTADLLQDTFIIVLEKARNAEISNPSALGAFVRQVGINLYIAYCRKRKRQATEATDEIDLKHACQNTELLHLVHSRKLLNITEQCISQLSQTRDRTILIDYFVYEKPKSTICNELNITVAQFDRVLHRARVRLKGLIFEQYPELANSDSGKLAVFVFAFFTFASFGYHDNHSPPPNFFDKAMRDFLSQQHSVYISEINKILSTASESEFVKAKSSVGHLR